MNSSPEHQQCCTEYKARQNGYWKQPPSRPHSDLVRRYVPVQVRRVRQRQTGCEPRPEPNFFEGCAAFRARPQVCFDTELPGARQLIIVVFGEMADNVFSKHPGFPISM